MQMYQNRPCKHYSMQYTCKYFPNSKFNCCILINQLLEYEKCEIPKTCIYNLYIIKAIL